MCKIILSSILLVLLGTVLPKLSHAQTRYVLFDQDRLADTLNETLVCKRTYAGLESDSVGFPDLTIFNFFFRESGPDYRDSKKEFQGFQNFLNTGRELPVNVLVTITPLTTTSFTYKDVTTSIENREMDLLPLDSLLRRGAQDIFYSIYAPMGIFDFDPELNLKRTDYRLVIKHKNKYRLVDNETLTEYYYIGRRPIEFYIPNAAGIFTQSGSKNFSKELCLNGGRLGLIDGGSLYRLKGGIMKDTTITIGFEKNQKIPIDRFWTLSVNPAFTKSPKVLNKGSDWYAVEGIGDFEFNWKVGIINGNFLDYFKKGKLIYFPDKQWNKEKVNFWYRTKTINGKKLKDFFKGEYIESGLIKTYM
ncbi:hypothetical protein [Sphingobacterium sp. SYP-B4668]|uniref:hypothetical protein n=1 Tax=Sphingobacterium sp. SYP-B4668 TaxID=2996035 RepID=UPI0022DE3A9B|nr:hypothetical protein [Sphingobacterium sp. SYP-B4668]